MWRIIRALVVGTLLLAAGLFAAPVLARADNPSLTGEWLKYRDRFVGEDGRVRDTGNKDVSHTEGQGWAMLFAQAFDDRATFDRIWLWTRDTLRRPEGGLFSWRWDPNDKQPVADPNNATDGDVLIAWALLRAARHWHVPAYADEARRSLAAIRAELIRRVAGRLVLLPGIDGFTREDGAVIVNPSYYVYPALGEFARLDGSREWSRLRRDGLALLSQARFGTWQLPADWVAVDQTGSVTPASPMPPRFGFDAIRVPLYLVWGGEATAPRLSPEMRFWSAFGDQPVPAWVDVTNGAVAPFPAPSGFRAIIDLVRARLHGIATPLPQIAPADDYYSASLILLANLARHAAE